MISLVEKAICRTPVFSDQNELDNVWLELKNLISEASPEFFETIKKVTFEEIAHLPNKAKETIWKYFNRAKYRSTPFGGFASVSLINIAHEYPGIVQLRNMPHSLLLPDWKDQCLTSKLRLSAEGMLRIQTNATCYTTHDEIRYLETQTGAFRITSIENNELVSHILQYCKNTTTIREISSEICDRFNCDQQDFLDLLEQLFELELLFTEQKRNVTGIDYFKRFKHDKINPHRYYRIDKRDVIQGSFTNCYLNDIRDFFIFYARVIKEKRHPGLNEFISGFRARFDNRLVPLGYVLDPEYGIDYLSLGAPTEVSLQDYLLPAKQASPVNQAEANGLMAGFTNYLLKEMNNQDTICLENYQWPEGISKNKFPNTFSAVISFIKDFPVLESAGGCTANALLGRFTLLDESIHDLGKSFAELEQKANPDIVFFDIAYANEEEVDNVNRRLSLYNYELAISTWTESKPLHLSDIWVTVQDNEIILWSKSMQKRLVPRMSSAYNYERSSLSLFRFLGDMQFQGLSVNLSFKLCEIFPGLNFYPRVTFRGLIISPAMWLIPEIIQGVASANTGDKLRALEMWLMNAKVSRYFKYGLNDQKLMFDCRKPTDLLMFLQMIGKGNVQTYYIWEADLTTGCIKDEMDRHFNFQLILNFKHNHQVYTVPSQVSMSEREQRSFPGQEQAYMPGSNWAYLELYSHPIKSNTLLKGFLISLLISLKEDIEKWYFIRFNDPSPHLRLRINFFDKNKVGKLLLQLYESFSSLLFKGIVSDIQIKTYFPEWQRYGFAGIEAVEDIFHKDSQYVISMLREELSEEMVYVDTLFWMDEVFTLLYESSQDKIDAVILVGKTFANELNWDKHTFKKINFDFKAIEVYLSDENRQVRHLLHSNSLATIENILILNKQQSQIERLVVDIVHMHVNRLFHSYQRVHEALLYQYLLKYLKKQDAYSKRQP